VPGVRRRSCPHRPSPRRSDPRRGRPGHSRIRWLRDAPS